MAIPWRIYRESGHAVETEKESWKCKNPHPHAVWIYTVELWGGRAEFYCSDVNHIPCLFQEVTTQGFHRFTVSSYVSPA
ncbi:hypothetical protein GCM10010912_10110 [Paenibacillus albidus]|uniref:Uncharacterized protein n=1 Tax=Paenibacillus albidus TaxID=2041023 RepID=A0A917FE79_9BACL|nr:hypothetical protein GCM10010912_10110 [Paenibacillus albidus]